MRATPAFKFTCGEQDVGLTFTPARKRTEILALSCLVTLDFRHAASGPPSVFMYSTVRCKSVCLKTPSEFWSEFFLIFSALFSTNIHLTLQRRIGMPVVFAAASRARAGDSRGEPNLNQSQQVLQ